MEEQKKERNKKFYEFKVEPIIGGFIAHIGCKKISFPTLLEVAKAIEAYWNDPECAMKQWVARDYNIESGNVLRDRTMPQNYGQSIFKAGYSAAPQGGIMADHRED